MATRFAPGTRGSSHAGCDVTMRWLAAGRKDQICKAFVGKGKRPFPFYDTLKEYAITCLYRHTISKAFILHFCITKNVRFFSETHVHVYFHVSWLTIQMNISSVKYKAVDILYFNYRNICWMTSCFPLFNIFPYLNRTPERCKKFRSIIYIIRWIR